MERLLRPATALMAQMGLGLRFACLYVLLALALGAMGFVHFRHVQADFSDPAHTDILVFLLLSLAASGYLALGAYRATLRQARELRRAAADIAEGREPRERSCFADDELGRLGNDLFRLKRTMGRRFQEVSAASDEVFNAATELSGVAEQSKQGSVVQSEAVEGIASSIEEISVSINAAAVDSKGGNTLAAETRDLSLQGEEVMQAVIGEIHRVEEAVARADEVNESLRRSSAQIGTIVQTIEDISEQTNLLALNAAIESARAGENGRGFAVVSGEVRTLAGRTHDSTREIADLITDIQAQVAHMVSGMDEVKRYVSQGVSMAGDAGEALSKIRERASGTRDNIERISEALSEQSQAGDNIAANVERISVMAAEQRSAMEETAATAEYLLTLSRQLRN